MANEKTQIECPECGTKCGEDYDGRCPKCDYPIAFGSDYERVAEAREKRRRAAEEQERRNAREVEKKKRRSSWSYFGGREK